MNPAALSALVKGDLENFLAASTPGSIEAQEAAGQRALAAQFKTLPINMDQEIGKAFGFEYGEPADDIFVSVTAPDGWQIRPTDHSMHSDIVDDQGRKRGSIFYKAAFYDRSANGHWSRRYATTPIYDESCNRISVRALDTATGNVLLDIPVVVTADMKSWERGDKEEAEATAYLDANFADWKIITAYW